MKRFECQESCGGKCCTRSWSVQAPFVFLTKGNVDAISEYLGNPPEAFASYGEFEFTRFSKAPTRQWFLKLTDDGVCRFLKFGKCMIYEVRPTQCRTYPFWPENMNQSAFKNEGRHCPGIGKGDVVGSLQMTSLLTDQIAADEELCKN